MVNSEGSRQRGRDEGEESEGKYRRRDILEMDADRQRGTDREDRWHHSLSYMHTIILIFLDYMNFYFLSKDFD